LEQARLRVRFEPLGEEIECDATETVIDAAFRQGYNLAHGCREGRCSACKCYLLAGDVDLAPYSNFALSDAERANGYALMCRALPESDVTIELLHYDPDNYRPENPISEWAAQVVAADRHGRRRLRDRAGAGAPAPAGDPGRGATGAGVLRSREPFLVEEICRLGAS
jgi:propane monooxygenase reductase component